MTIAPIMMPTPPVAPELSGLRGITGVAGAEQPAKVDLAESFGKALQDAHAAEHRATDAAERFAKGDPRMGIHEVVIASEKANIAVRYATTLKNKALEAYRELMATQV
ncbi:MAG: flagellar hook-basal body complex protein FliE [Deltaproteobacteria bacterium]|nr:MAG: flagellar hook-basal body complex protein FliE [Deltaproteobacteria bacterium]TMQ12038.1 MAG: flagellar hook-basal body complex protein FliE [Deltaproteobacteria bacterium]